MSTPEQPGGQGPEPELDGERVLELELGAHMAALRAELARTRTVLLVGSAACLLGALLVLYAGKMPPLEVSRP